MRSEVLYLALIVGAFTWAFRYVPLRANLDNIRPGGALSRFLAATGPAAIAALFVAEVMPLLQRPVADQGPLVAGVVAVVLTFGWRKSAVMATLCGALAYGAVVWVQGV